MWEMQKAKVQVLPGTDESCRRTNDHICDVLKLWKSLEILSAIVIGKESENVTRVSDFIRDGRSLSVADWQRKDENGAK